MKGKAPSEGIWSYRAYAHLHRPSPLGITFPKALVAEEIITNLTP